ncbi:hypothetical protein EC845_3842 [Comamonas sp. BIGb0124]|uniref:DUF2271 domain-containing protein n=1 Tax=Comamonas sp. BIGb0124 TaxID=2485130 RepID=UPI000F4A0173|nr:DUF2271 domain-containing protein [Comamonas sp. BIGb0124]ROR18033.1 hypothetical protein EC845_3842 [Comamonas sp. BIGb0124]
MGTPTDTRPPTAWVGAALALGLACGPAAAAGLSLDVTLPEVQTGPVHRPYLAAWVERPADQSVAGTLAVWYDQRLRDNLGTTWLRNLRTWWRKAGETLVLPADGVSGPTRPSGRHTLRFGPDHPVLAGLPAGEYNLVVEVAREQGGRELLRAPFQWQGAAAGAAAAQAHVNGTSEIAAIQVGAGR